MGRLNKIKGPDILLQAFISLSKQFADWHLVLAGPDGGMQEDIQSLLKQYEIENRVHLIGYITGEEKSEAYHAANVLVIPSRQEAMSIVALEAAACGTPVVMTDQCGFSELVHAGGAIEVSVNEESMVQALAPLLSNTARLQEMGLRGKDFISQHYTWSIAAQKYHQLCKNIVAE